MSKNAWPDEFPTPPFTGFSAEALQFFRGLAENQNKTWFDANKTIYETQIRDPLISLVAEICALLAKKGLNFTGDPKRALFRINRDVRFSRDKSPYKTNAGAAITRDGEKNTPGVLYIHVAAQNCFTAAGFYRPDPPALHRLRTKIANQPAAWRKMSKALSAKDLHLDNDDTLVNPPKGFDAPDADIAVALKLKSWVVRRALKQNEIQSADLPAIITAFALDASPLLKFGWAALDGA